MLHTFTETQVKNAIVKTLNRNYEFIAEVGRYINPEDIENIEVWFIGLRVKFVPGVYKYRYRMVSKKRVCEKLSPNKQEVTFTLMGRSVSDRLHLSTYFYKWDDSRSEHIWTVTLGYATKQEARTMQFWLFKKQKAAHSVVRGKHRTSCEHELKVWGMNGEVLNQLIARVNTIRIIKPNGAWRFMQGDKMLVAVYLEVERDLEAQKFIEKGYRVEFEDPTTGEIAIVKLVDKKIEYCPVRKVS